MERNPAAPASRAEDQVEAAAAAPGLGLWYCLPPDLLERLAAEVKLPSIDPRLYQFEKDLTASAHRAKSRVGLWDGRPIDDGALATPLPVTPLKEWILSELSDDPNSRALIDNLDQNLAQAEVGLDRNWVNAAGYCGWLMSNPTFIDEHDRLLRRWNAHVRRLGFPIRGPLPIGLLDVAPDLERPSDEEIEYAEHYSAFLDRWELAAMQAPYLPEPRQIQAPVLLRSQATHLTRGGGQLIYIPANMPLPDRDDLRQMIGWSRNAAPDRQHMQSWDRIVHVSNGAKNRIARYARIFRLQHYWMILHARWGTRLDHKLGKLRLAFAEWLMPDEVDPGQGEDSIRKDLQLIAKGRGGTDWYKRTDVLNLF